MTERARVDELALRSRILLGGYQPYDPDRAHMSVRSFMLRSEADDAEPL